ncbi:T9SS type A sorting domain-containing protein [Flavobacterium frigoris]|uniref:Internalin-related protein n=1 Tax=Flavobacterium frigoris (strain PS1) TaxID=1086011 RepID=H7FVA4_FLAFP|nr:T9SS type A sorting domain-containing protein [Flavobacterium frigoris]EIA07527.1 internalin-related protein [Flavobacterium frigoris PS1]
MKKLYFLLLCLLFFTTAKAQIVAIPDATFKEKLVLSGKGQYLYVAKNLSGVYFEVDANKDGEIQTTEALQVSYLNVIGSTIIDLTGILSFKNLETLYCNNNKITALDVRGLIGLKDIICSNNQLKSLNINGLINLTHIDCSYNQIVSLNLDNLPSMYELNCGKNNITTLNTSDLVNLWGLNCWGNQLESLFLKNGKEQGSVQFNENPNLKFVCADESELGWLQNNVVSLGYNNCVVNSYCSFNPGGTFYTIQGNQKIDLNNNGCEESDSSLANQRFNIFDGLNSKEIISNSSGSFRIAVKQGNYTITPILENLSYFNISPSSINVNFPTQTSPYNQDFCISPKGLHNDLEITILPTVPARPGFDATYKIIYKNKGNSTLSGLVTLTFNDAVLDYVSSVPVVNNQVVDKLSWNYTNLQPFEKREITVTLNVNSPMETPAVNLGDRLSFNALITPVTGDEKPVDNSFAFRQIVVGSFDPNDKTCLEGDAITPELIGEYVHYLIRFENTGTYPAQNIVVKDLIDLSKFDISTLVPTKGSHEFITNISNGNKVEFIFESINLPFDDATNDGYIAFKIKTLPTLVTGDSFTNEASIYFDYNFPILTNKATSTFKTLGITDFAFSDYFSVYPNPVNDILNINVKTAIELQSIAVLDVLGQLVIAVPNAQSISKVDVSKLATGKYFLKMNTDKGTSNMKFIKN